MRCGARGVRPRLRSRAGYWANRGGVIAGAYPGHLDPDEAAARAKKLVEAGVHVYLNLTV